MEILFWLVPAAAVTLVVMAWVGWWGRESKGAVNEASREAAARKLGEALSRESTSRPGYAAPRRTPDHTSGVAVRPSKARPVIVPGTGEERPALPVEKQADQPADKASSKQTDKPADDQAARDRRAS